MTAAQRRTRADQAPDVVWLAVSDLSIDPKVQRQLDTTRAARIANDFDPEFIGILHVSVRGDGAQVVIDGQHRLEAMKLLGWQTQKVPCRLYHDLTLAEEAHLFRGLNTFAKPRAFDMFKVRIVEGDAVAVDVQRILRRHGWRLATGDVEGGFTAVVAAEKVYTGFTTKDGNTPELLDSTLGIITAAWGHDAIGANGYIVTGIGLFLQRYANHDIDKASLVDRLSSLAGGPNGVIGKARGIKEFRNGTTARCLAEYLVELYNKRRTKNVLPSWRDS